MISDRIGEHILDLSAGGQPLGDSLNLLAVAGGDAAIKDVILPLAHPQIDDWTTPPYDSLLTYKLVVPEFPVFQASTLRDFWSGLTGEPRRIEHAYRFEGQDYPDYGILAGGTFAREARLATCPEQLTHDPSFTRSYFWWTQVAATENDSLYDLVADLKANLETKGKHLHVVVLPTNLGLLEQMQPGWGAIVEAKQEKLVTALRKRGVSVLDLSAAFSPQEFSSQWCACIHLNETGRIHLSKEIAQDIIKENVAGDVSADNATGLSSRKGF